MNLGEHVLAPEIVRRLGAIVHAKGKEGENWPVSGFIEAHHTEATDSVIFACDPNRKGNPSPAESRLFVPKLVAEYQQKYGDAELVSEPAAEGFRAILGLAEGYWDHNDPANPSTRILSLNEALSHLPKTASGLTTTEGTLYSARYWGADSQSDYFEPGYDLHGPAEAISASLQMLDGTRQKRGVFEITDVETQVIQRPREA
jgi:hypothetical protein